MNDIEEQIDELDKKIKYHKLNTMTRNSRQRDYYLDELIRRRQGLSNKLPVMNRKKTADSNPALDSAVDKIKSMFSGKE